MLNTIVFIIGAPSSGKSTLSEKVAAHFGFSHLNIEELVNDATFSKSSKLGNCIKGFLLREEQVPSEIVVELLKDFIVNSEKSRFLIDGFPKTVCGILRFEEKLQGKLENFFAMYLDCHEIVCIERCFKQRKKSQFGFTKHSLEFEKRNRKRILQYFEERDKLAFLNANLDQQQLYEEAKSVIRDNVLSDNYIAFSVL